MSASISIGPRGCQHATPVLCVSLIYFVLQLLHEVMILCYVCSFPYSSPLVCLFVCLPFLFYDTASWDWSGWHPRSHSGQCAFHLHVQFFPPRYAAAVSFILPTFFFFSAFHLSPSSLWVSDVPFHCFYTHAYCVYLDFLSHIFSASVCFRKTDLKVNS